MPISIRSRKAKGRLLQNFVRDIFRNIFRHKLELEDIEARIMGGSGTDVVFTPAAKKLIPFDIEVKNQEKFNLNEAMKQAISNTKGDRIPVVVFSKNQDDVYIALKFMDLINLLYPDWDPSVKINKKSVIPLNLPEIEENA